MPSLTHPGKLDRFRQVFARERAIAAATLASIVAQISQSANVIRGLRLPLSAVPYPPIYGGGRG